MNNSVEALSEIINKAEKLAEHFLPNKNDKESSGEEDDSESSSGEDAKEDANVGGE